MIDERARHDRRLRRLRRAARRWSVIAGVLVGATLVLMPYAGLGLMDAFWAGAAGGSTVLAAWRWVDYRELAAQPVPAAGPAAADRARGFVEAFVVGLPWGREALSGLRRQSDRSRLRGSATVPGWRRLDRAAEVLAGLPLRAGEPGETILLEASAAEKALRELARRASAVERGLRYGGPTSSLDQAVGTLVAQFEHGVTAYEELVGAAVTYVAEQGRTTPEHQPSLIHLTEATDLLRGIALGLAELRTDPRLAA
jgi:hypothetical protein